jgi:hypothetical protein
VLGWSGAAIAVITVGVAPFTFDGLGQLSTMLFFAWTIGASISLLGREGRRTPVPAVA